MSCMYFYLLYFLQVQWSNEGCWCEIMATLPRAPHIMWQWKVGRLGRALFVWLAGRKVWGAGDHCASVNMGRRLLKCCHRFWLNTEQPQNSQTSVFGLLTFHAWFWQMRMWLCGLFMHEGQNFWFSIYVCLLCFIFIFLISSVSLRNECNLDFHLQL